MQTGSDERGFTLIEVMIAILLTVIAVVGIISLHMTETRAASFSRHSTEATTLATDKLEQLRTQTAVSGTQPSIDALGAVNGIFERDWTVTPVGTDYSDVTVRVGWDEDEAAGVACAAHATCDSKFCRPSTSRCAGRAVVIVGRRNQ